MKLLCPRCRIQLDVDDPPPAALTCPGCQHTDMLGEFLRWSAQRSPVRGGWLISTLAILVLVFGGLGGLMLGWQYCLIAIVFGLGLYIIGQLELITEHLARINGLR